MLRMLTQKKKSVSELLPEQKVLEVARDTSDVIVQEIAKPKDANVTKITLNVITGATIRGCLAIKIKQDLSRKCSA